MNALRYFFLLLGAGVILASAPLPGASPASADPASAPAAGQEDNPTPTPSVDDPEKRGELRELGGPSSAPAVKDAEDTPVEKSDPAQPEQKTRRNSRQVKVVGGESSHGHGREVVAVGRSAYSPPGDPVQAVIAVFGNSRAEGPVNEVVVAVFGNSEAKENVGDAVVAVFGNATADKDVGDSVVAVFGSTFVNGHVHGQVVSVFGTIHLGPNAVVDGEVVSVGGQVVRNESAVVRGGTSEVPFILGRFFGAVGSWFPEAPLKGRLIAPQFIGNWVVAIGFLGFYVFLALVLSKVVTRIAETLEQKPGQVILAAFLSLLITPPLMLVLIFTFVGPFVFLLALAIGMLIGKAAVFSWIGRRIVRVQGWAGTPITVLIGGVLMTVLYAVPYIGLLAWSLATALGLGMAVYTMILSLQRDRAVPPAPPIASATPPLAVPAASVPPVSVPAPTVASLSMPPTGTFVPPPIDPGAAIPPPLSGARSPAAPIQAYSALPRAGFWIRVAAAALDCIMIAILSNLIHGAGLFLFWLAAYSVVMWALKGTTVGGVICGLKVIRVDDRPMDWTVALVRGLAAVLSLCAVGLGFIWVAFDDQKQSWHDKVAGTTIVRVPKGVSLI